jgi:L-ascorbate metabolism protein UlaG (beta-lactamase superfamily)
LSKEAADLLHKPDVLFAPVGGFYTINAAEAGQVVEALQPAVTIPMHFLTPRLSLPISPVDDFLAGKPRVKRIGGATVEVTRETLPAEPEVWVLEPAR